ncbi:GAF domain-containing protein [Amaricoccus sp.]|uniref:GAF domain-containing protein n=1 Tax=Amaricoccus sp. TaxID=1872485 RepID=UPI001B40B0B3|nr:GAF domain-containing protein [Amaricoccus sp.]MBP7240882.1 GAF domain-containing protein [Amaricoccus sp.]
MTPLALDTLRDCMEGVVPAVLATCDETGVPNVSFISQVHYVDPERVALSYQFFNKTRANLLATRQASVQIFDPVALADYRLELDFEETRTEGPLFETMKAKLAGIASHSGMDGVFRLLGADVFRVRSIETIFPPSTIPPPPSRNLLSAARRTSQELAGSGSLGELFDRVLSCLRRHFGIEHAMVLMLDENGRQLFTVASLGYPTAGIGSEVEVGHGVVGVAARERSPIRICQMAFDYSYGRAIRDGARSVGVEWSGATEIPYPGLPAPESQIALPILSESGVIGVLFAESPEPMRFRYDDEDALMLVADRIASLIPLAKASDDAPRATAPAAPCPDAPAGPLVVRHYGADDSVFLNHDYLIKGVAGAIVWMLVGEFARTGRTEFTNRELRLDPRLRLPEFADNLEARLLLLQRRLRERMCPVRIEKTGRGRFRLDVPCPLVLEEIERQ